LECDAGEGVERKVEYLTLSDGSQPFVEWFENLDKHARARVNATIDKAQRGVRSVLRNLRDGVCEIKVNFGPGYRVYYGEDGDKIILLISGGDKRKQTGDIETVKAYWRAYEKNKKL